MSYSVRWVSNAVAQVKAITDYIEPYSVEASNKLLDDIIDFADSLGEMPLRHPECRELPTKSKIYRNAVYANKYRIIYRVVASEVVILGIIHTSRSPAEIKKLRGLK
jgi:plasmid stabilization system protein ParE